MVSTTQIIGGPGTGKTTHLMGVVESLGSEGVEPTEIGFSSFTRAARQTAATRAAEQFGLEPSALTQDGWFRTLHSVCYRMLGVSANQMISDNKASLEWLEDVFGEPVAPPQTDMDTGFPVMGEASDIGSILGWWATCRNSLKPIQEMQHIAPFSRESLAGIVAKIRQYERRKWIDGKLDFADLPLRVAGVKHDVDSLHPASPLGDLPDVRAWILDEYQDTFPAIHAAARRIVTHPHVEHVFVAGDPFQSLYSFAGGHPRYLQGGWDYTHRDVLRQSYRCPPAVMKLAEDTIRKCSDYYDRQIAPRKDSSGGVSSMAIKYDGPSRRLEGGSWMFLARTNSQASRLGSWLSRGNVPWRSSVGGAYLGPKQRVIAKALLDLHSGRTISKYEWFTLAGAIQVNIGGTPLLNRGFKSEIAGGEPEGVPDQLGLHNIARNGATESLVAMIAGDNWSVPYKQSDKVMMFKRAADSYGIDAALNPQITVGTIHSVKGDQSDYVVLYDALTTRCRENLISQDRTLSDEEYRVWYVGITRARERLITARFGNDKHPMLRYV